MILIREPADFARHLRDGRHAMGIGQIEFARRCGVSQSRICAWETGKAEPELRPVIRVLSAMHDDLAVVPREEAQ